MVQKLLLGTEDEIYEALWAIERDLSAAALGVYPPDERRDNYGLMLAWYDVKDFIRFRRKHPEYECSHKYLDNHAVLVIRKEVVNMPKVDIFRDVRLKFTPDSRAELMFVTKLMPMCCDRVSCELGVLFGKDYNTYVLSGRDYNRISGYLTVLRF